MPYKRRKYKKPGRLQVYGAAGKQLYKDVMYLKSLVNSEPHYHVLQTSGNFDGTGTVLSLCDIPQGDDAINRTGTSVLPRFLTVRLLVNKAIDGAALSHETFRVIIFKYWGEDPNTAPSVSVGDILEYTSAPSPTNFLDTGITGAKRDRERRIQVLRNKIFTLDQVATTSRVYDWNITMNGPKVKYKQHIKYRSSATEEPCSGGLYCLVISNYSGAAAKSSYNIASKINYYDN